MRREFLLVFLSSLIFGGALGCGPCHFPPKDAGLHFVVQWDGKVIPGITHISALRRKTEVVEHRSGDDSNLIRRSPGKTGYQPIVFKRPRSDDQEFERWSNLVWTRGAALGSEGSLKNYRKDVRIEFRDPAGNVLWVFRAFRCWPSEYVTLSESKLGQKSDAMEILVLEHEGWERENDPR